MANLLTDESAAIKLSITTRQLRDLVRDGAIPHIVLPNGEVRFSPADLDHWIFTRRRAVDAPTVLAEV